MVFESLEDRRVLDGSPWQNPVYSLDVNDDGVTTTLDAMIVVNRILSGGTGPLPDPGPNPPPFFYDTSGDNRLTTLDLLRIVNGLLTPPAVSVASLPFTADLTPLVTVTAAGTAALPDGTIVDLDVDLNADGDFGDPGEMAYTQATLTSGSASFAVAPALPRSAQPYAVNLRARVKNINAVVGTSADESLVVDASISPVLADFVSEPDPTYGYRLAAGGGITNPIPNATTAGPYMYYILDMTSQTWRSTADVDRPGWQHWIEVYVPVNNAGLPIADLDDTAFLVLDGGSNTPGAPQSPDPILGLAATRLKMAVARLMIVPNQPLTFTGETTPRSDHAIAAYTFDKFMDNLGQVENESWLVILPMVKSAVRAMDSLQDFLPALRPGARIADFAVSGYSNLAWTTWLAAAVDDRVAAIIPGVFENLNLPAQVAHHWNVYGFFSSALADYDALGVLQRMLTPEGAALASIVDPYRYLTNGRFDDMPKLLVNSPGDEFFPTDAAQFYFSDLPGNKNYLRYVPNTSHALEFSADKIAASALGFLDAVLHDRPLPEFSWTVDADQTIRVQSVTTPSQVLLWQMNNVNVRDFRRLRYPGIFWFNTPLADQGGGTYVTNVAMPATGARAYFVELTFPNPVPGLPDFVFTTEVRAKTPLALHPWPFAAGAPSLPAGSLAYAGVSNEKVARDAVSSALVPDAEAVSPAARVAVRNRLVNVREEDRARPIEGAIGQLMQSAAPATPETDDSEMEIDADLVESESLALQLRDPFA